MHRVVVLVLALALTLSTAVQAKPDWTTIEGYVPEKLVGVASLRIDREARASLLENLPLDPEVVGRVLDEHFALFAKSTGINPMDAAELFLAAAGPDRTEVQPLIGLKVAVNGAKVLETVKKSGLLEQGWKVSEPSGAVLLERAAASWAFVPAGVVLWGPTETVLAVLKRKGEPSPSNKDIVAAARARSADGCRLLVTTTFPPGFLPPKAPPSLALDKHGLPVDLPTKMAGFFIMTTAADIETELSFRDEATATLFGRTFDKELKLAREGFESAVKKAAEEAGRVGILAPLLPELVAAKLNLASFDEVAGCIALQPKKQAFGVKVPMKAVSSLRALGGSVISGPIGAGLLPQLRGLFKPVPSGR